MSIKQLPIAMAQAFVNSKTKTAPPGLNSTYSILDTKKMEYMHGILEQANRAAGLGSYRYGMVDFFRNIDMFGTTNLPGNRLKSGFTFITRPSLCLQAVALADEGQFHPVLTDDKESMMYAIRCMLDPTFHRNEMEAGHVSSLLHPKSPFMNFWMNGLIGFSGAPDINLETETTAAGFGGEDHTRITGFDYLQKTQTITLNFRDIQGGPIMNSFFYLLMYMAYASDGRVPIYRKDADQFLMYYTMSIYRFVVDPSTRFIEHAAKFTGCFPDAISFGEMFNFSETERIITSGGEFSVPFKCSHVLYNHPLIYDSFNSLVKRYAGSKIAHAPNLPRSASMNYGGGIPFIPSYSGGSTSTTGANRKLELVFKKV